MNKPKVSIITVVKNGAGTIGRAIESVLGQTYENIEYIVIDGRSTDGTVELIKQYEDRLAFWSSEPDSGISDAFNKGIAHATGDWIGILNADDWYENDAVKNTMQVARDADVIHGGMQLWEGGEIRERPQPDASALSRDMTVNHPTVFVRRELYQRFGGFRLDYRYAMDYELILRFWVAGARFVVSQSIITNQSFGGISGLQWRRASREIMRAQFDNGLSQSRAYYWHVMRLIRGTARRLLETIGLRGIVEVYRRRWALMRKLY